MAGCSRRKASNKPGNAATGGIFPLFSSGNPVARAKAAVPGKAAAQRCRVCSGLVSAVLAVNAALVLCWGSWAQAAPAPAHFWVGRVSYEANARQYTMDVAPYVSEGRTYVPVRYLAYALGVPEEGVRWDGAAQTVSLRKQDVILRLKLSSPLLERQAGTGPSVSLVMDVAPEMRSGRVFLPARYVAAGLGYSAAWGSATQQVTLAPGEIAWAEELVFDPNPVEPDKGLSILVRTSGSASRPVVRLRGVGGSAEPNEYWRQADKITLSPGGPGEWVVGLLSPGQAGVYPAEVTVNGLTFTAGNWLLKVYPEGFLNRPGYATPEEAVRARFAQDFKGCSLREIEERPLLPDDLRDPRYHKLFLVTFYQPYDGPVLPAGMHSYFYYILRDGPNGFWRVAGGGTGP
ncbi:copper amine oxidase N-terminal domain-containing protein [Desulfofundulus sp.]|uniref:copper amine oxidase N-terminal domain-containing protein n=1 Tax=Desulfofundulus sp. TaxID=2282750 RepID=UPI003C790A36